MDTPQPADDLRRQLRDAAASGVLPPAPVLVGVGVRDGRYVVRVLWAGRRYLLWKDDGVVVIGDEHGTALSHGQRLLQPDSLPGGPAASGASVTAAEALLARELTDDDLPSMRAWLFDAWPQQP